MQENKVEEKFAKFIESLPTEEVRTLYMLYMQNKVRKILEQRIYGKR